ncbi:MAG: hypothetical protein H6573_13800 [Lewinellaceae bacterium]|nr:hypothetical protein [Phaeodactylibacter sp.]MCB0614075.1 hypothetical protein [Phaeodactylibacter sp.]MCB9348560.1 hypothetical protein [Lewinellaceae bacterium]
MTRKLILLLVLVVGFTSLASAQSWRKLKKEADQAYEEGQLADAADKYEQAWRKKRKKEELIHQAGELYYQLRDYRKAAEAYRTIKEKNSEFPLVGLKYARCLKQDGQYDRAITEFEAFMESFTGDGKNILQEIIQNEIAGCRLGMDAPAQADRDIEMLLPGEGINSDKEEFAPYPLSDNELYYSSTVGDRARIYASRREGSTWSKGEPPRNFPVIQSGHFCNGSMSPDGSRMYFTVCSNTKGPWNDVKTRCEIFVTKRVGVVWSQPERLPDYINMAGVTATHPFVIHQRGQEILFFSSNREGGRGGMDLWYASRDMGADNIDFTFPVNLGPVVNTLGDEITPFYNVEDQTLYFSSNGHISIGGFDVFSAIGDEVSWSQPDNLGMPVNSSADDYFYILNPSRTGGFMTSNRVFAGQKPTTTHEDIFEFAVGGRRVMVKGNVYDRKSGEPINDITVSLFQVFDDGRESELISRSFNDGKYSYEILPNRRFRVEVSAYGYGAGSYRFSSDDMNTFTYGQPIFLEVEGGAPSPSPSPTYPDEPVSPGQPDRPVNVPGVDSPAGTPYTARGRGPNDDFEYQTMAPRHNGTYYKIQLAAVGTFNADRFGNVSDLGRVDTELILARGLTRVLVADFFSLGEARSALQKAKNKGYSGAYIVEYIDGERYSKVK